MSAWPRVRRPSRAQGRDITATRLVVAGTGAFAWSPRRTSAERRTFETVVEWRSSRRCRRANCRAEESGARDVAAAVGTRGRSTGLRTEPRGRHGHVADALNPRKCIVRWLVEPFRRSRPSLLFASTVADHPDRRLRRAAAGVRGKAMPPRGLRDEVCDSLAPRQRSDCRFHCPTLTPRLEPCDSEHRVVSAHGQETAGKAG